MSWGTLQSLEQKTSICASSGAPDTVWCLGQGTHELAALGFFQSLFAIIHRTVQCAPDMSGEPMEQRSTAPNGQLR
jgi:hypothetical protein